MQPRARAVFIAGYLGMLTAAGMSWPSAASAHVRPTWVRDADGSLAIRENTGGIEARVGADSPPGSIQALPMPAPPGPSDLDRDLARERETVARQRLATRQRLERAAQAAELAERKRRDKEEREDELRRHPPNPGSRKGSKHRPKSKSSSKDDGKAESSPTDGE